MSRRRGPGVGGLAHKSKAQKQFHEVGTQLEQSQLQHIEKQLNLFKEKLEIFAQKHKNEINKNPKFRSQFQMMCAKVGVDPLASGKGFWGQLLGVGDFYYELGVQIIDVCLHTRGSNGGLMAMDELLPRLKKLRGRLSAEISTDDIKMSIKKISKLGNGFDIVKIGHKEMIVSVPIEMNRDHFTIMEVAQKDAYVSVPQLCTQLSWPKHRVDAVLQLLLEQGMIWVDEQNSESTTSTTSEAKEVEEMEKEMESEMGTDSFSVVPKPKITLYWFPSLWLVNGSLNSE